MNLPLNEHEMQALCLALDRYLPELEFELARVKLSRDRHELVDFDQTLRSLRARLGALCNRNASPDVSKVTTVR